jgi:hypothetical protein
LVVVGASGVVAYSSDAGVSWTTITNSPARNLNAVAYTGIEFLAIGASGTILTSSDGSSWAPRNTGLPEGFNTNLLGLTFGTAGQLKGIGMLVGTNGAVVLAGTAPEAPNKVTDATNCANSLPNPPVIATIVPDDTHPSGTVVVDWYDAPSGGTRVATATDAFSPPDKFTSPNDATVYTYFAEARDLRTGFISANRTPLTLTINPRPTATVAPNGPTTICNGQATTVQATLTGIGPWTVTWSDSFVQTTNAPLGSSVVAIRLVSTNNPLANLPTNYTYTVAALADANCTANSGENSGDLIGSAVITVNPRPTSVVSGSTTLCNSSNATIQAALTGIGPWTVTWSDGLVQTTNAPLGSPAIATRVVTTNNPLANLPTNYTYTVTALTDANCTAGAGDRTGNAVITVNPRPTSVVSGSTTLCNSSNATIQAALTGIGPWTVTWSDGLVQTTNAPLGSPAIATRVVTTNNPSHTLPTNYTYTVTTLIDANCAAGSADRTGSAVITVNPTPLAPTNPVNQTGCVGITNPPLSITLAGGDTAHWYDAASNLVASGSATYTPTNQTAGTNRYFVAEANSFGCESATRTEVDLILEPCPGTLSISLMDSNAIVQWYGNFILQSSTNLVPANWLSITQGMGGGLNYWTNSILPPPTNNFFRLYAPGN